MPFFNLSSAVSANDDQAILMDKPPDGIFDLDTVPRLALQDLYEHRMRYAIHAMTPEAAKLELTILPSSVIAVPMNEAVFISNIYRDTRARWLLRGVDKSVPAHVKTRGEMTQFSFKFEDRTAFLFVRLSPPHHVEAGVANGELTIRIMRSPLSVDFGLLSELSIAAGEDFE